MSELRLNSEYLPATQDARADLVLLAGWASSREIWRPVLASLRPWANITLVDLPSCHASASDAPDVSLDSLLEAILSCAPQQACYMGWSLGGNLCTELAAKYPERVSALVTLCCNPCFVTDGQWSGMARERFSHFCGDMVLDPVKTLRRFDSLQVMGTAEPRRLRRQLQDSRTGIVFSRLAGELELLGQIDSRKVLPSLTQAQLHLLGGRDELLPSSLDVQLSVLLEGTPTACVDILKSVGHIMPLEIGPEMACKVRDFLAGHGLLREPGQCDFHAVLDKGEVGRSFSVAALHYDSVAELQRDVGTHLLHSINIDGARSITVLDLGCGTGHFYPQLSQLTAKVEYVGVDLAPGMVAYARNRFSGGGQWLVGDAEHLPVAANSVDLVFSSLAIQWCSNPRSVFAELARILRPGGQCVFTSLGPDTLKELRASWACVDDYQHVNDFMPLAALCNAAQDIPGITLQLRSEVFSMQYDRVGELLRELKTLGAHNMNKGRSTGLTGRAALGKMYLAYEKWRDDGKLPATYDVQFGFVEKGFTAL